MKFIRHMDQKDDIFQKAFSLYQVSFPEKEQRSLDDHIRALADPRFFCETIWEGEQFCGLIFYWELGGFQYIEHLAIEPSLRGSGIGSRCLEEFCKRNQKIVLEIDPPIDDISIRRKSFYERLGFHYNGYYYIHPSYQKGCTPHQLLILSWPKPITEEEYRTFIRDMWEIVMLYSQNSASVGECRTPLSEKVYPYSKNS